MFNGDYFNELLERIREIRASERMFYQKITDLYIESEDYDVNSPLTKEFSLRFKISCIGPYIGTRPQN